ncbi:tripartite tricarboxylate transporter TctB family protein [Paenalcaligenes niemegkensis]|nr:tripartite tricarboxylate transporter TctB family protein [Paenalcaligenes niemegkensis]MCQ9617811.1 tripartite tricarboxylate transporter TctB family protein [Paenalcaligenes niemegkensis]
MFILACLSLVWAIPAGVIQFGEPESLALSAAFWPYVIASLLGMLGFLLLVQGGLAVLQGKGSQQTPICSKSLRVLYSVLLLIPYYFLAESIGLLLASVLAFAAYSLLAGEKNYKKLTMLAVVVPAAITVFFIHVAQVLVPLGPVGHLFS